MRADRGARAGGRGARPLRALFVAARGGAGTLLPARDISAGFAGARLRRGARLAHSRGARLTLPPASAVGERVAEHLVAVEQEAAGEPLAGE